MGTMNGRQLQHCLLALLLLITLLSGMTVEESMVQMQRWDDDEDVFGSNRQRRVLSVDSVDPCEPDGHCEVCTASERGQQPECDETGNIQLFKCDAEGKRRKVIVSIVCFVLAAHALTGCT